MLHVRGHFKAIIVLQKDQQLRLFSLTFKGEAGWLVLKRWIMAANCVKWKQGLNFPYD